MGDSMNQYQNRIAKRSPAGLGENSLEDVVDLSGPIAPGVVGSGDMTQGQFDLASRETGGANEGLEMPSKGPDYGKSALAAGKTAAKGGNAMDVAGAGLMATGNPYAMAAGLGLMTLSGAQKAKQAKNEQKYKEAVARAEAKRSSLETLSGLGQRLAV
jgi:hypothetical protein